MPDKLLLSKMIAQHMKNVDLVRLVYICKTNQAKGG